MKTALKIILPVVIIALAFAVTIYQIKNKPMPEKKEKKKILPVVRTEDASIGDFFHTAEGFGIVQASRSMNMVSDVAGRAVYVSPKLKAGAVFRQGETLFEIEKTTYESALASAVANLRSAEYSLSKTVQEADISAKEWEIWNGSTGKAQTPSPLVKYEPQLNSAKAAVDYAKKAVEKAKSDLDKTAYKAPFDCMVSAETVEAGMVIKSGESVGTLIGINEFEAVVPIASGDEAGLILSEDSRKASPAEVTLSEGTKSWTWKGYVARVLPDADAKTGLAKVVVVIPNPNARTDGRPSLTIGSSVTCSVKGRKEGGLVSIPKSALRENSSVWVHEKGSLRIKQPEIMGQFGGRVFIKSGIQAGEKIIVNRVQGAVDGMKVKQAGEK